MAPEVFLHDCELLVTDGSVKRRTLSSSDETELLSPTSAPNVDSWSFGLLMLQYLAVSFLAFSITPIIIKLYSVVQPAIYTILLSERNLLYIYICNSVCNAAILLPDYLLQGEQLWVDKPVCDVIAFLLQLFLDDVDCAYQRLMLEFAQPAQEELEVTPAA